MTRGTRSAAIVLLVLISLSGCQIYNEWEDMNPVTVDAALNEEDGVIALSFSAAMDRARTEDAIEVRRDGSVVLSQNAWTQGARTLTLSPDGGIETNDVIVLSVETSAEDQYGNSLAERYERTFDLRAETDRPFVVSVSPDSRLLVTDLTTEIVITASESLDRETVFNGISISPDPGYLLLFDSDDAIVRIRPNTRLERDTRYTITVDTSVRDTAGNTFAERWESSFRTAAEIEQAVESVQLIRTGEFLSDDTTQFINNTAGLSFEKDDSFQVRFVGPVDESERASAISVTPSAGAEFSWNAALDTAVVSFSESLTWNTEYTLNAADTRYRFVIDGAASQPPSIAHVVFIPDIDAVPPSYPVAEFGSALTFSPNPVVQSAFDVYVDRAAGASLVFGSVLSAFSLSASNAAVAIDLDRVEIDPTAPPSDPVPDAQQTVVRFVGNFTKAGGTDGIVTLELSTDLEDDLGNFLAELYRLSVNAE